MTTSQEVARSPNEVAVGVDNSPTQHLRRLSMPNGRVWLWVMGLTLAHMVACMMSLIVSLSIGMDRFETGAAPTALDRIVSGIGDVLFFPLVRLAADVAPRNWFPGLWGYVPLFLNSLLWGTAAYALSSWILARLRRRSVAAGITQTR